MLKIYPFSNSSSTVQARRWTAVLSVIAMSFGCYIHGTTVSFPAVFIPLVTAANGTGVNVTAESVDDALSGKLAFFIYKEQIPLFGETWMDRKLEIYSALIVFLFMYILIIIFS